MSYDLQVWSVYPVEPSLLQEGTPWNEAPGGWSRGDHDWQIVINHSDHVLAEDIPDEVSPVLPGIQYLTQINLEGRTSNASRRLLLRVAKGLARTCRGVLSDLQQNTLWTPSGVKRTTSIKRTERFSTLTFSWWFLDGPMITHAGRERFLHILTRDLPEALPKRYGLNEPPQYLFADTGTAHLLDFLDQHLQPFGIVWYPQWPVVGVHLGFPDRAGGSPKGFRANLVQVEIDREVATQTGWERQLRRFWLELSRLIRPFYGDVRTLGGRIRRKAGFACDRQTEHHPVRSWWWRGVPPTLGHAVVLGSEYQHLLPAFADAADTADGLAFISTENWVRNEDLKDIRGAVPTSIAAKPFIWPAGMDPGNAPVNMQDSYPECWPFEAPFN